MALKASIQSAFLSEVRKQLPAHISLADTLAEILGVSRDSAYRRIRCETIISLDEVKKISDQMPLSMDVLLSPGDNLVPFQSHAAGEGTNVQHWFATFLTLFSDALHSEDKHLYSVTRDLSLFHYFQFPELAAFKIWLAAKNPQHPHHHDTVFCENVVPKELLAKARKLWEQHQQIPSTEIWNSMSALITLQQIEYCHACGFFAEPTVAQKILDQYEELLHHLCGLCATGTKGEGAEPFRLYLDEVMLADNTLLLRTAGKQVAFIRHGIDDMLLTFRESYCDRKGREIMELTGRASLISGSGEKERKRFFNTACDRLAQTRDTITDEMRISFVSASLRRLPAGEALRQA